MIDANRAYFESKYNATIKDILKDCEKEINNAIKMGEFDCNVSIYIPRTPEEVFQEIVDKLEELGYHTKLGTDRIKYKDAPCDQCAYWEQLYITWKKEED